jgi:hypothetical protein
MGYPTNKGFAGAARGNPFLFALGLGQRAVSDGGNFLAARIGILRDFSSKRQVVFIRSDISANEITVWTRMARSMLALVCCPERMQSNQFFS